MFFGGGFGGDYGPPQGRQTFEEEYHCFPGAFSDKPELEDGDKILLPASALDQLARMHVEYPMLFEIRTPSGRTTHCSVLEFTAPEGVCYLPYWMMSNLTLEEGTRVTVRNVSLPKANFLKLQPQSVDFLDIHNHKAVLEFKLRSFSCVTVGDQLCITYNDRKYYLEVKEVRPGPAASIIEADVNVDFDPPVGYKEPEPEPVKPTAFLPEAQKAKKAEDEADEQSFQAFSGGAQRLDGKQLKPQQLAAMQDNHATTPGSSSSSSSASSSASSTAQAKPSQTNAGSTSKSSYQWGAGAGTIKTSSASSSSANDRRAAMAAAAEKRSQVGGQATKWGKKNKLQRFQTGAGNRLS